MEKKLIELYRRLSRGPAFLFLGQDYLRLESGQDTFLEEVLRKYGEIQESSFSYSNILNGEITRSIESSLAWMHRRCDLLSIPNWLKIIADFAWNGIYSSAIDSVWPKAFYTEWRELQPIFEEKYRPINPRNQFKMHCTFLFGCVNRMDTSESPPLTKLEWLKRKQVAVALARRLPENVTPFGILIIEGYAGDRDWLSPEDLLPIIDELNPGQTHIFSVNEELETNQYVIDFAKKDKLILHKESLASCLLRGEESGHFQLRKRPEEEKHGRRIQLGDSFLSIPLDVWNQISRSANVLDDTILLPPPPMSEDQRYLEFRTFLSESNVKPIWSGYAKGFAFNREFEGKLLVEVANKLQSIELRDDPIIVHGQTGTGKTIALGALAYNVRKQREYPVLFIERRSQRPIYFDIDAFCQWSEDSGASNCLIIWDGMVEVDQYYDLMQHLQSRGRKVVVVGSCYRVDPKKYKRGCFIEALAELSKDEISNLRIFLESFDHLLVNNVEKELQKRNANFLVALYRFLPPTRGHLRSGVTREIGHSEQRIRHILTDLVPEFPFGHVLAHELLKAGLIKDDIFLSLEESEVGDESFKETEELIALVMVPGQFGLNISIEMVLRALGKMAYSNITRLLKELDIFRWYDDLQGNIYIGPRQPLEAKLFVQATFGGAKIEVAFAKKLLLGLSYSNGTYENPDIQFAIDLIRNLGPNGPKDKYYAQYFKEIADALTEIRVERGISSPRLMLQEAHLLREWVKEQSHSPERCPEWKELLSKAEQVLYQARDIYGTDTKSIKMYCNILVELASVLGTKAHQSMDLREEPQEAVSFSHEARKQLMKARILDPDNYHAIDVLAWITKDLISSDILDPHARIEAEADIRHAFEMAELGTMGAEAQERFEQRRFEMGRLLHDKKMSEEAFNSLLAKGFTAGYYLRAIDIARELPVDAEISSKQYQSCSNALSYLEEHREDILDDPRCLYLLFRLWWTVNSGRPLFYKERQTVPFDRKKWEACLNILNDLDRHEHFQTNPIISYFRGIATFHLGFIQDSFDIFRELEGISHMIHGRRRIIRHFLASTPHAEPQTYNGTVFWVDKYKNRGALYVEELRRQDLTFRPLDFKKPDIKKNDSIQQFHIAFNFIGPIADPKRFYRVTKRYRS